MTGPSVSVVIPALNEEDTVAEVVAHPAQLGLTRCVEDHGALAVRDGGDRAVHRHPDEGVRPGDERGHVCR